MVFASYSFLFIFLPIALVGYYLAARLGANYAVGWLVLASLAFYAVWNPAFVILLVCSITFNFAIGRALLAPEREEDTKSRHRLLFIGVAGNLLPLIFFKYLGPALAYARSISLVSPEFDFKVILPLGISFFTFTQIGYLVECNHGGGRDLDIIRYAAFVTFFPHLIAGPIYHIREIGPQLLNPVSCRLRFSNLSVGTSFFIIGLAKKILLADPLAEVVKVGFAHPGDFQMFASWLYALAYSLQLYFDFSGYSDMAIGLGYMFGIRLPINFNSPYKSRNIIDFWQRWHITLTRYLTLLLYNPLGMYIRRRRLARPARQPDAERLRFSHRGPCFLYHDAGGDLAWRRIPIPHFWPDAWGLSDYKPRMADVRSEGSQKESGAACASRGGCLEGCPHLCGGTRRPGDVPCVFFRCGIANAGGHDRTARHRRVSCAQYAHDGAPAPWTDTWFSCTHPSYSNSSS